MGDRDDGSDNTGHNAGNDAGKGDGGDTGGGGGGWLRVEDMAVVAGGSGDSGGSGCCILQGSVISHIDMYRTNVLMYRKMILLARPTKVRC